MPAAVPELLCMLAKELHAPHPIPATVKRVVMEFKRTHHVCRPKCHLYL